MKKIFCVMVAVVLCFGAVLVSASAETPSYNYNGVELPYPSNSLVGTDYKYFTIISESNGSYTLVASDNVVIFLSKSGVDYHQASITPLANYKLYTLNNGAWEQFGEGKSPAGYGYILSSYKNVLWANHTILHNSPSIAPFDGDLNFVFPPPSPPLHEQINGVTGEAVNVLANDTFDTLGVLVPIGIAIMAIFVGVALIPRVIYKFL